MTRRTRIILVLLLVAASAISFIFIRLNNRTYPPAVPSGTLAFTIGSRGHWDIALVPPDGELVYLTPDERSLHSYFPSWDFSGERINFLSNRAPDGDMAPTQVYPDGTNFRVLDILGAAAAMFFENRLDWDPSYNRDGTLLWSSLRDLNLEIYVRSGDTDPVRLTSGGARDWFAAWSPDGTRIAFSSDRAGNEDIYVMDADGQNLRRVTLNAYDDMRPVWSLDGETILFVSERDGLLMDGTLGLYVVSWADIAAQTDDARSVAPLAPDAAFEGGAAFSADGKQIAYMARRDGFFQIYVMDVAEDGTFIRESAHAVTTGSGSKLFPVWRP